ncbi:methyltransferase domain-containing protein [Pseudoalteromonas sp. McH1-7]|uniref:methyltransferase domain-containing protein n=1 Tax=Pseudoalteromonas sp. McH1-7 TaxID=2745574 RepID=UPI001591C18B|nr:methyltransferase domain-containing protein [Pseudoalteromonas sp. McH1-7]NUZ12141.1 methyltransferase domain-containing protein [Pseudoalteromonas sp. McH1-7]
MQDSTLISCGLCLGEQLETYHQDKHRLYWQCQCCHLVMADPNSRLTPAQEKAIYDSHENDLEDAGYRRFLTRVSEPLIARLSKPSLGLDFGCGPGPLLAKMLEEAGHQVSLFDLYYANNPEVLKQQYDFIVSTEVVEHLSKPGQVLQQLLALLDCGQPLVLMTKLVIDKSRFANWHYKNDLTHISFFSQKTFAYFAAQQDCDLEFIGNDVIILTKRNTRQNFE